MNEKPTTDGKFIVINDADMLRELHGALSALNELREIEKAKVCYFEPREGSREFAEMDIRRLATTEVVGAIQRIASTVLK